MSSSKRKISYRQLETRLSIALVANGRLEAELKNVNADLHKIQEENDALHRKCGEQDAKIAVLEENLRVAEITNAAHIVVIQDLEKGALHLHNQWLMRDWEARYSALNDRLVSTIHRAAAAEKARDAHKVNAERLAGVLAKFRETEKHNDEAEALLAPNQN